MSGPYPLEDFGDGGRHDLVFVVVCCFEVFSCSSNQNTRNKQHKKTTYVRAMPSRGGRRHDPFVLFVLVVFWDFNQFITPKTNNS